MNDDISYIVFEFDTRDDWLNGEYDHNHYSEFDTLKDAADYYSKTKPRYCASICKYQPGTDYQEIETRYTKRQTVTSEGVSTMSKKSQRYKDTLGALCLSYELSKRSRGETTGMFVCQYYSMLEYASKSLDKTEKELEKFVSAAVDAGIHNYIF